MKNIKFEDIVAFIRKAIENKCKIIRSCDSINIYYNIYRLGYNTISTIDKRISWERKENGNIVLAIDAFMIQDHTYNIHLLNERKILEWELLLKDVEDYICSCIEEEFNEFFNYLPLRYQTPKELINGSDS